MLLMMEAKILPDVFYKKPHMKLSINQEDHLMHIHSQLHNRGGFLPLFNMMTSPNSLSLIAFMSIDIVVNLEQSLP